MLFPVPILPIGILTVEQVTSTTTIHVPAAGAQTVVVTTYVTDYVTLTPAPVTDPNTTSVDQTVPYTVTVDVTGTAKVTNTNTQTDVVTATATEDQWAAVTDWATFDSTVDATSSVTVTVDISKTSSVTAWVTTTATPTVTSDVTVTQSVPTTLDVIINQTATAIADVTNTETSSTTSTTTVTATVDVVSVSTFTSTSSLTITVTAPVTVPTTVYTTVPVTQTIQTTSTIDVTITQTVSSTTTTTVTPVLTCGFNVIQNGNFNTNIFTPWTVTPGPSSTISLVNGYSNTLSLYSNQNGAGYSTIKQTVNTVVGKTYTFSMIYNVLGRGNGAGLQCAFDNAPPTALTVSVTSATLGQWHTFTGSMIASSSSTTITCAAHSSTQGFQVELDNLSLQC